MESQVQGTKQEEIIFANCNPKFFLIYSSTYCRAPRPVQKTWRPVLSEKPENLKIENPKT